MPARTVIPPEVRDGDTTVEVGERLNLSSSTIYDLINNGTLRATQVRVGSTWRLNRESVDAAGRTHGARAEEWPKRRGVVTEWLGNGPLERCLRGASGEGDLTDLEHCFGSVAGCDCAECRQEREHEARRAVREPTPACALGRERERANGGGGRRPDPEPLEQSA